MPRWNGVQYNLKDREPPFAYAVFKNETWLFSLFEQPDSIPLYTAPVERQWVDLTDGEIEEAFKSASKIMKPWEPVKAVIAAFKEKNK